MSSSVWAVYYQLERDAVLTIPPDAFCIDDDDVFGGIAPVPRPWKPTAPLLNEDAISPDGI